VMRSSAFVRVVAAGIVLSLALGAVGTLSGCKEKTKTPAKVTEDSTAPTRVEVPPPPKLGEPRTAVYSYLVWISFAYRTLNSAVASMTFTPFEEVRVDAYVQYNREQGRAIDQQILNYDVVNVITTPQTATVIAREDWKYRYIDISTGKYTGDWNDMSYDTTYTLVKEKSGWLVTHVDAKPHGKVK